MVQAVSGNGSPYGVGHGPHFWPLQRPPSEANRGRAKKSETPSAGTVPLPLAFRANDPINTKSA